MRSATGSKPTGSGNAETAMEATKRVMRAYPQRKLDAIKRADVAKTFAEYQAASRRHWSAEDQAAWELKIDIMAAKYRGLKIGEEPREG